MTLFPKNLFFLVALAYFSCVAAAENYEDNPKRSPQAATEAQARIEKIKAEIASLKNHPWAGEYYQGDGLGVNVTLYIAPDSGFVFEWHGCMGLYDRNYGSVTVENGTVKLNPVYPNKRDGFQGIDTLLTPVAWGKRSYLIAQDEFVRFCNNVNSGWEPRKEMHGFCLLRRGDEKIEVAGRPAVPEKYRAYILDKPIEARVIWVGKIEYVETKYGDPNRVSFTINAGSNQGVFLGMEMRFIDPDVYLGTIKITKVETSQAEATLSYRYGKPPQIMWRVSTRRQ